MNKLKTSFALMMASVLASGHVMAQVNDPLNIVGVYDCTGYDSHEGAFTGDLTFTLDEAASHFPQSFGAYKFKLNAVVQGEPATYSGIAAAQGQSLAMYFAHDNPEAATDRGVGIALMTHDQDAKGAYRTTLHKSYYLPDYMRTSTTGRAPGGSGTETCVKRINTK